LFLSFKLSIQSPKVFTRAKMPSAEVCIDEFGSSHPTSVCKSPDHLEEKETNQSQESLQMKNSKENQEIDQSLESLQIDSEENHLEKKVSDQSERTENMPTDVPTKITSKAEITTADSSVSVLTEGEVELSGELNGEVQPHLLEKKNSKEDDNSKEKMEQSSCQENLIAEQDVIPEQEKENKAVTCEDKVDQSNTVKTTDHSSKIVTQDCNDKEGLDNSGNDLSPEVTSLQSEVESPEDKIMETDSETPSSSSDDEFLSQDNQIVYIEEMIIQNEAVKTTDQSSNINPQDDKEVLEIQDHSGIKLSPEVTSTQPEDEDEIMEIDPETPSSSPEAELKAEKVKEKNILDSFEKLFQDVGKAIEAGETSKQQSNIEVPDKTESCEIEEISYVDINDTSNDDGLSTKSDESEVLMLSDDDSSSEIGKNRKISPKRKMSFEDSSTSDISPKRKYKVETSSNETSSDSSKFSGDEMVVDIDDDDEDIVLEGKLKGSFTKPYYRFFLIFNFIVLSLAKLHRCAKGSDWFLFLLYNFNFQVLVPLHHHQDAAMDAHSTW